MTPEKSNNLNLASLEAPFLKDFEKSISFSIFIDTFFSLLIVAEIVLLTLFTPFLLKSAIFAVALSALLLTVFGFLLLKQYLASQKLFATEELLENLLKKAKEIIRYKEGDMNSHVQIAKLLMKLSEKLYLYEYRYYKAPSFLPFLKEPLERISAYLHWEDVFNLREMLLKQAAKEHLLLVRANPIDKEAHALLANAYVLLSGLYMKPAHLEEEKSERYIPQKRYSEKMSKAFKETAEKAIEEFKILKQLTPNDPWVYSQLAYSYRDLKMPHEEKLAYEAILELRPNDLETLYKLGNLYFQQGENAFGLKVYEELKKAKYNKADELLISYGRTT